VRETHPVHCCVVGSTANEVVVKRFRTGQEVLEYEIREEQAATIGRLARELRTALDALAALDRHDPKRARLVDAAAYALWNFVVQRECSGFRGTEHVLKDYAVPAEVRAKMGAARPR
jgi:hypothetical protein